MGITFWIIAFALAVFAAIVEFISFVYLVKVANVGTLIVERNEEKDTYKFVLNDFDILENLKDSKVCTLTIKVKS